MIRNSSLSTAYGWTTCSRTENEITRSKKSDANDRSVARSAHRKWVRSSASGRPRPPLADVDAPRVGAEVVAEVPDLEAAAAAQLEDPPIREIDAVVDVQQALPGTLLAAGLVVLRRIGDERPCPVLLVEGLEQLEVHQGRPIAGVVHGADDRAGLLDHRRFRPVGPDRPWPGQNDVTFAAGCPRTTAARKSRSRRAHRARRSEPRRWRSTGRSGPGRAAAGAAPATRAVPVATPPAVARHAGPDRGRWGASAG